MTPFLWQYHCKNTSASENCYINFAKAISEYYQVYNIVSKRLWSMETHFELLSKSEMFLMNSVLKTTDVVGNIWHCGKELFLFLYRKILQTFQAIFQTSVKIAMLWFSVNFQKYFQTFQQPFLSLSSLMKAIIYYVTVLLLIILLVLKLNIPWLLKKNHLKYMDYSIQVVLSEQCVKNTETKWTFAKTCMC